MTRIDSIGFLKAAIVLLLAFAVLLPAHTLASQATPVGEADAKCAECHGEIYRKYLATPMANASGPAIDKLIAESFTHKPSGIEYSLSMTDGKALLTFRDPREPHSDRQHPLSYFFGSGHLATTYIYSISEFLFESPVAWYAASKGYDMKPGLEGMNRMPPSLPMQSSCLRCHMSAVQPSDSGTINRYKSLPFLHSGITCEACHGDAQSHSRSGDKSQAVNPARLSAEQRDSICISCHLEGDVTVERAGHSALNYRPGESISTYLSFYVYGNADATSRGVSEVEQFAKSTCKRMSGDKMSCTSCHDPHFTPNAAQRTAFFRGKCLGCHNQPEFEASHHPEKQDCTSCHMPAAGAQNIPHVAWTDHRILRISETLKFESPDNKKDRLTPIFSPGASDRDLAMANYKAMLEGNRSLEPAAWEQLTKQREAIHDDPEALDALGVLSAERGDRKAAEHAFRRVLELVPDNLTALSNLGTLLAQQGRLKEAISTLQPVFDRNPDIAGLATNLARIECAAGDAAAALHVLETTLVYNPDLQNMPQLLAQMASCNADDSKR
jgi:predicted CXXCH cytochrome family protein